jgi:exopolyphosphatase/guanosine-5'-triphosphate,3'-diphosphate pyrophosphatase
MLSRVYAIGGTATTLAALSLGLDAYDSNKVTGARISYSQMRDLSEKLLQMSVEEIAALPCVSKGREDVLAGGAVWLTTIMQTFAIEHLIVSDKDNLEGYAIKKGLL